MRQVAAHLRANGPTPGTRHYSTCILIYDAILDGLTREETRQRLLAWVRDVAPRGSRDARERLDEALADTERLVAFYYRPRRRRPPRDPGPRRKPPSRLRRGDLVRLQARLGREGGRAVSLAGRILEHVKANGLRIAGTDGYYCELPVVPLGITSDVERRTRDVLRGQGLLRPVRPAIAKLDDDHPLGPRAAKPALWRVRWAFADTGALLPPMSALFPRRRKGQVADFQVHEPVFVSARSGGVGVHGGGDPFAASCSRCGRGTNGWTSKDRVQGARGRRFGAVHRSSPSTAPAA